MLVRRAPPQDGLEVGRRRRQDDLVAANDARFVAGQRHVEEVFVAPDVLQVLDDAALEVVQLKPVEVLG